MYVEEGVEIDEDQEFQALMDFVLGPKRENEDSS